jgi:4'-phosphopantetheinyl transferase
MFEKSEYTETLLRVLGLDLPLSGEFPTLEQGEVHIWTVSVHGIKEQLDHLKSLLTEEEIGKISFYKFEHKQHSYIATQALLRVLLSLYLDIKPMEVKMKSRSKGKPFLIHDRSIFFNISNSDGLCVFAFSGDGEVGIDLERIRQMPDIEQLIQKNLTSREKEYVLKDPDKKLKRFFRFWTIKESYLKAIGEGMRLTPDNLEFSVEKGKIRLRSVNYGFEGADWQFKEFTRDGNYTGTLTYAPRGVKIREMMPI